MLSALRLVSNAHYLQVFEAGSLTGPGEITPRREFRRLRCWPAVLWISRDGLRLLMA